ncbi:hypothetical protein H9P43_005178 [Blastocladiella emersonii ATCC 22665]|nr:hypothetical protein H9P43_005178 [Blastocladiella emersonii ATCC 22665]
MNSPWLIDISQLAVGSSAVLNDNQIMFFLMHFSAVALNFSSAASSLLVALHLISFCASVYTYLLVCRGKRLPLGDYDWYLHTFCLANMAACASIVLPLDGYGFSGYFCLWNVKSLGGVIVLLLGVALTLANAFSTIVGLAHVRRAIASAASTIRKPGHFEAARLKVASRCLVGMIRIASLLHLPRAICLVIIAGFHLAGYIEPVSMLASAVLANSAGLVDSYVYIQNQKLKAQAAGSAGKSGSTPGRSSAQPQSNEQESVDDSHFWQE